MTTKVNVTPELTLDEGRELTRFLGRITMGELTKFPPLLAPAIHKTHQALVKAINEAEAE